MHVSTGQPGRTPRACSICVVWSAGERLQNDREPYRMEDRQCKVASRRRRVPSFDEGGRKFWVPSQTALFFFFLPRSSPLFLPWSKSAIISRRKYFLMRGLPPDRPSDGGTARQTGQAVRARRPHTQGGSDATAATDKSDPSVRRPK